MKIFSKKIAATAITVLLSGAIFSGSAFADVKLRLSHFSPPDSEMDVWVNEFSDKVKQQTEGRVTFRVYPASQLGDWEEVHGQVSQGAIDAAVQPLSSKYDKRLAIAWFPYSVKDYKTAEQAWNQGEFLFNVVSDVIDNQNLTLVAPFAYGMGGLAVNSALEKPTDINADRGSYKIRIWPGGMATHAPVMKRLGYNPVTMPWSEVYTGVTTGVIDGMIGGVPENALRDWNGAVKTWVQINDHFDLSFLFFNKSSLARVDDKDRDVIYKIAKDMASARFTRVEHADSEYRDQLVKAGVNVVMFNDQEMTDLTTAMRNDVWPNIKDEIGEDIYNSLVDHYNN